MTHIKQFTRTAAIQLQDDNLALTLQLWAESVAKVLVFLYVAGVIASETVHPYLTQLWETVRPTLSATGFSAIESASKIPQLRDAKDAAHQETVNVRGAF